MNTPLYARMNEFAPASSGIGGIDESHAGSQEASQVAHDESQNERHDEGHVEGHVDRQNERQIEGQDGGSHEQSVDHGSLFEQCTPPVGKFTAKAGEGEVAATWAGMPQRATLTADVPDLKIGDALGEGSLVDGYRLHEVALFDSGIFGEKPTSVGVSAVSAADFAPAVPVQFNNVPNLELDYSGAPESTSG